MATSTEHGHGREPISVRWRNFRCFEDTGVREIRPLTLLIGPNNGGKSSFLDPLLMLKQTLESSDPRTALVTNGELINVGTYADLITNHDLDRDLTLAYYPHLHLRDHVDERPELGEEPPGGCELVFDAPEHLTQLSLKRYTVYDIFLRRFLSRARTSRGRYSLSALPGKRVLKVAEAEAESDQLLRRNILDSRPTNFFFSASQVWNRTVRELETGDLDASGLATMYFRIVETLQSTVASHLLDTYYVGPLRRHPQRLYEISGEERREVGTRGDYAPEMLFRDESGNLLEAVNKWLNFFHEGRRLETKALSETAFELNLCRAEESEVNFADTGFGLSQILPLLVQGADTTDGALIIAEQPEIHLNPRLQASLADFFVGLASDNKSVLVETHSEHLLLSLRRLVAEEEIDAADIALYYVEPVNGTSTIREVPIQQNGNIPADEWPIGFFEDALHEAFALAAAQRNRKS